jgi:hypothetical protein
MGNRASLIIWIIVLAIFGLLVAGGFYSLAV